MNDELRAACNRLLNRPGPEDDSFEALMRNCQQHNSDCDLVAKHLLAIMQEERTPTP